MATYYPFYRPGELFCAPVDCNQPAMTALFEYSGSLACLCLSFNGFSYQALYVYPGIQFRLPCTPPGQFFMGAKLFIGTPWMGNEGVLKIILVWAMLNCMVSMPTHSEFEKGGLPIKLLISQLLLIQDY